MRNVARTRRIWLLALAVACPVSAQPVITTVAGTDWVFPRSPLPARDAPIGQPGGLSFDSQGNLYIPDFETHQVYRVTPAGMLSIFAGNGIPLFSGDGERAQAASLFSPFSTAVDRQGNLYIADEVNGRIRRVSPAGIITTFAGNGSRAFVPQNGPVSSIPIEPWDLAIDAQDNIYFTESRFHRVRKLSLDGMITTVAGTGQRGFFGDGGQATNATLDSPRDLALGADGSLYISDRGNARVRRVAPDGIIRTVAGGGTRYRVEGPGPEIDFGGQPAVALEATGRLLIAAGPILYRLEADGTLRIRSNFTSLPAPRPSRVTSVAVSASGDVFLSDLDERRVFRVSQTGALATHVGNGQFRRNAFTGMATSDVLSSPHALAVDSRGSIHIRDQGSARFSILGVDGRLRPGPTELIGVAEVPGSFFNVGMAFAANDNLYVARAGDIVKISPSGQLSRFAGGGFQQAEGIPATSAQISPWALTVAPSGVLYFTDVGRQRVYQVGLDGILRYFAGTGAQGFSGDNGPARNATFFNPFGVAADANGNVYIADFGNLRVRKVDAAGRITTFFGTGLRDARTIVDGAQATSVSAAPLSVTVDSAGNLLLVDNGFSMVLRVTPQGIVERVAGSFVSGFSGDGGRATLAALSDPRAIVTDAAGNVYIADSGNHRVRKVLAQPPAAAVDQTSLSFEGRADGPPSQIRRVVVSTSIPGLGFQIRTETAPGTRWLEADPVDGQTPRVIDVSADPAGLQPGLHEGTLIISLPQATPPEIRIAVRFQVGEGLPPEIQIDKQHVTFTYPRAGSRRSQIVVASNAGSGRLPLTLATTTSSGGSWLTVTPSATEVTPRTPATLRVEADPARLTPGTYRGQVVIRPASGNAVSFDVTMTISDRDQAILLSQTGLSFTAVAQGGVVPPQSFGVINLGTGSMPWSASTSTLSGGNNWLRLSTASGTAEGSNALTAELDVLIDQTGLAAGRYYGQVRVDSTTAANSPQVLTVFLEVLPSDARPASVVQPGELVFEALSRISNPAAKEITIYNLSGSPVGFRTVLETRPRQGSAEVRPRDATVEPSAPQRVLVQPVVNAVGNLLPVQPGAYRASIALQFSDGTVSNVPVTSIVPASALATEALLRKGSLYADGDCQPSMLVPAILSLGQAASVPAGWPAGVAVDVKDDCGRPLNSGAVTISFSNGDRPFALVPLQNGKWHGTWQTGRLAGQVLVRVEAEEPVTKLRGTREVRADLRASQDPPLLRAESVISAAGSPSYLPLAPGAMISIYGERLAEATAQAPGAPLPLDIGGTQVVLAGRRLPLYFVSPGQLNAMLPFDLATNTAHQVLVRRGLTYSQPVPVNVSTAQPALFTLDGTRAIAVIVRGASQLLAGPDTPARAGDTVVFYAGGLGAVNPSVEAGSAAPADRLSPLASGVRLRIGGVDAPVAFAGLAPGFVGLYQINAVVAPGISPNANAPVLLEVEGQVSPVVTLPVN